MATISSLTGPQPDLELSSDFNFRVARLSALHLMILVAQG